MRTLSDRITGLRRRMAAQDGLTIIEMAVAFGIMFISLLALARTATVAFSDTANSRQRQTGNQLANQLLEQVAALPWETLQKGLATEDLSTDTANIVSCAGTYRYLDCTGEEIAHTPGLSDVTPLVPHMGTVDPTDPSYEGVVGTYSWRVYVTKASDAPSAGGYRVIAIVDWEDRARQGLRSEVEVQTIRYSPSGCVDDATHTVTGPCSPYFYGTGRAGGGTVVTTGTWAEGKTPFDSLSMTLLSQTADAQLENVFRVEGDVSLPTITSIIGGVETVESEATASAADTDPATPAGTYSTGSVNTSAGKTIQLNDSGNKLTLSYDSGASGSSTSATAAGSTQPCNLQVDGKACGFSTGTQSGAMTQTIDLKDPGFATLVSVGTSSTPVTTYVRRSVPPGENGLIRETVTWNVPEIRVGGIPSAINPPGPPGAWQGYWARLSGFSATAVAEAGTGTAAPTVTINGGTIQTWHGGGYNSYSVCAPASAPCSAPTAGGSAMLSTVSKKTGGQQVDISGEVGWESSTVDDPAVSGTTRGEAKATIGSPFVVEMRYVVTDGAETVADLTIQVTAGRSEASTRYQVGGAG